MIAPLAWADFILTAVVIWPIALGAVVLKTLTRGTANITRQTLLAALFEFLQFGTMFSIFGLAQTLYFRGVISIEMEIFVIGLAAICAASSALYTRFSNPPKTS